MSETLKVFVNNPYQDASQTDYHGFVNNLSFTPTVEELNRNSLSRGDVSDDSIHVTGPEESLGARVSPEVVEPGKAVNLSPAERARMNKTRPGARMKPERL